MKILTFFYNLWWRFVFWWKKQTGWLDLNERISVTGTIVEFDKPDIDGDRCFNLVLDPGFEWVVTGFGGRLTSANSAYKSGSLHCEIPPWSAQDLKDTYDSLKVGDHVAVSGARGFDGVHLGKSMWIEVPAAIIRHMPNVRDGWFEIHPVDGLRKIG